MECRFIVIYMENHVQTALNIIVNTFNDCKGEVYLRKVI